MHSNEFKVGGILFAYTGKRNAPLNVKMFSSDFDAWVSIGTAYTAHGAREIAEDFIFRAEQAK